MACLLGLPSEPLGSNASNSATRSFSVSALLSVSVRICTVAEAPLPTITTDSGAVPRALLKTVSTCSAVAWALTPSTGMDTLVPPSKSIPKVKPRSSIAAIATATMHR